MVLSLFVVPVGATGLSENTGSTKSAQNAAPTEKFSIDVTANRYTSGTSTLIAGNWLQNLAVGNDSLKAFLQAHAARYVDLMPVDGKTKWDTNIKDTNAIPTFNSDGSVTITQNVDSTHYWPYVYTEEDIVVDLDATPYIYISYGGDAAFNLGFYYNNNTDFNVSVAGECIGSDFPAGDHTGTNAYCLNLAEATGLSGVITLNKCLFYTVGAKNTKVILQDIGFVSSPEDVSRFESDNCNFYLKNYTALMVEFMGNTDKTDLSGYEGAEYFVDAVIDCDASFDERPHQIKSKTDFGYIVYIPDSVMDTLEHKPARGDLVDASFRYAACADGTLTFYDNPASAIAAAKPADVNATVKLYNYDSTISKDGFNFWNGFWGWGGNVESLDGRGIENGKYQFPVPDANLSAGGYPMMTDGYALDYLFDGSSTLKDGQTSTLVGTMSNGGGLFQLDEDGYYYYDSLQNAAYYDEDNNKFVLCEDLIVRPWYHSTAGDEYKIEYEYDDYANVGGPTTVFGNFLPFNKVTANNITVDGAAYFNEQKNADLSANFSEVHAVDGKYTAIQNAAGSLEKYGLTNTAADKVLAGSKALYNAAYADIVAVNGGDITTARLEEQLDMGFGMTVDFDFYMPQSGMVDGEDMEFDFLGDDDVFVYLGIWNGTSYEYKLVLDIGGIHGAKKGNINFATGVVVDCPSDTETERTSSLKDIFGDEYAKYFDGETFADFTKLSLKFFYLERGGNISYCRLRFNIPTLPDDSLTIGKALDQDVLGSQTYSFRLLKAELNVETNQYEATNKLYFPAKTEYIITGTNETGKTDENGYFTLTPGQSVTFTDVLNKSEGATYYVVEEVISSEVDDQFTIASPICSVNGTAVEVSEVVGCADPTYRTEAVELRNTATLSATRAANMEVVGFTNMIVEENLGTLRITKQIKKGAEIDPTLTFDMRVTIGDKLLPVGTAYDVVNTATGETIRQAVVTKAGIVSLMAGETVVIERILSTSTFEVVEASYNAAPSYFSDSESVTCTSSKAYGTMPLGGTVEILVVNDDSSGLVVDKTVEAGKTAEDFTLTLEAFATGTETTITSTTPADIVLVLDQSASMYTPKGADADRYDCWDNPNTVNNIKGIGKIDPADMKTEKGAKLGYYVAQSKTANRTVNGSALYDWFVIQYVDGTGWVYVRVEDTTTPVTVSAAEQYVHDSGNQYYKTVVSDEGSGKLDSDFYYYESQYAALYESVAAFVESLASTEVDHRIAITGFASPYYDGVKDTTSDYRGTGLYINGTYYLYDSDYKYWGYQNSSATYGYTLVVSDEVYASMSGVLPSEMEGDTWVRQTNAPAGVTMVRLDPNKAGTYFAPFPADASLLAYNDLTNTQYASALVPVSAADGQTGNTVVSQSVLNSIEAIKTNYSQTCPAAGLDMAKQIFANRADGDGRDKIIILFTDGVPTVSLNADREHGASQNAGEREEFYSGMSGAEDAVNLANDLKSQYGVQIYTIGTSGLVADVPVETNNDNMGAVIASVSGEVFLSYVSSDYEGVSCVHTVTTEDGNNAVLTSSKLVFSQTIDGNTVEINENTAVRAASIYAKTSEDGISAAFEQIMKSVSTPSVTLDGSAVLREVLTDYFDLADGADLDEFVDKNDIKTYIAAYAGMVNGAHTFGTPTEVTDLDVELVASVVSGRVDTVEVSGFDYSANYVRQDEETGAYLGCKLIVKVPIKARDGFWGGNNVPTNKDTTAIYDDGKLIEEFPIPEVNVPIGVELSTVDRTIYYGNETNANVLFNELTVRGCGETDTIVKIENGQPVLTDVPEWMREFVEIELSQPDGIDPTASGSYTYAVQLAPTKSGTTNQSDPPSNMAGTPVGAVEAESTGNIYILVPQYVFKDSVVKIGAANDMDNNLASDVAWVKMNANQPDAPTIGVAPDLTLTFSVAHNAAIYDHTAVDVTVSGGNSGVDYEPVTIFKWENCENDYHEDGLGTIVEHLATAEDSKEFWIHIGQIPGHTVVIDFGHSVDVHVLNDEQIVSPALYSVDGSGCRFGTAEMMDGGIVRYTINTMAMDSHDTIYYTVYSTTEGTAEDNVHTYTSTVTVIPATTIYYEDNFGSITYDAYAYFPGDWELSDYDRAWVDATLPTTAEEEATDSTEPPVVQDEDRPGSLGEAIDKDNLYGYDSNYTDMQSYSMNSAKMFTATEESDGTIVYGTATFDFIGTGFDVISLTSGRTGTITVEIFELDENGNYAEYEYGLPKACRVGVVDTYYSYKYEDSDGDGVKEWSKLQNPDDANGAVNNTLYQVPVIKMTGLEHGKYEAIITVSYNDFFNHNQYGGEKKYDFYLDAIRIYDPANDGEGNEDIKNAYIADGEGWPEYFELRNLLINKNSFDSLGEDDNIGGIVFIDGNAALSGADGGNTGSTAEKEEDPLYGKRAEIADYANFGPNNELYLAPGQAVAFALDVITTDKDVLASVQLALKSVGGTANVKVYAADVENAHNILTGDQNFKTISTATDLYYNITSLNGHTVVIFNDADSPAILSVTNVKVTYKQAHEDGIQKNNFVTTQTVGTFALRSVRHLLASRGMTTGHSGSIVYTNNGDTHSAIYNCCGEAYVTDETHDYDQNTHACVCGAVDTRKNGIIAEDGSLYYYVGGQRTYAGLIELDGDYYYVRTSGEVVHGRNYWTTKTNGLLPAASYYFNESGKLCDKNGFVKEDGGIYYYVDGERSYAGLIYVDGNHYYVRSSGEVVTGRSYWTTKTNGLLPAASYYFDEEGKMQPPIDTVKNGIYQEGDKLYYYANGERTYAGLVQYSGKLTMEDGTVVDGIYSNAYIYVRSSGEVVAGRSYWITKTNDLLNAAYYQFDENGVMVNPPA